MAQSRRAFMVGGVPCTCDSSLLVMPHRRVNSAADGGFFIAASGQIAA